MKNIDNPYLSSACFFCGPNNPVSLKLTFQETETEPNELFCVWFPPATYKSFGNILHGGIQSGLFDEIMGYPTHYKEGRVDFRDTGRIFEASLCRATNRSPMLYRIKEWIQN